MKKSIEFADLPADEQRQLVRDGLLRLLARREHSTSELRMKMAQRSISGDVLESELADFQQRGWQSDERFAQSFVRQRINKGQGKLRIINELRQRQVADKYISAAFADNPTDWFELAKTVHDRRFHHPLPLTASQKQQHLRFLQYRGFNHEEVAYACDCAFEQKQRKNWR